MKKLLFVFTLCQLIQSCDKEKQDDYDPDKEQLISQKTIGGSSEDDFRAMVPAADGGVLLVGYTVSDKTGDVGASHGSMDLWLVRLNDHLDTLWTRNMGGAFNDYGFGAIATSDGGFAVVGGTGNADQDGRIDWWVLKLNSNGDTVWTRSFSGGLFDEDARSIAATPDGGFIVVGTTYVSLYTIDIRVIKLNSEGHEVWNKMYGGTGSDYAASVSVNTDGAIFVGCYSGSADGDVETNKGDSDWWILKLHENGEKEWSRTLGGDQHEHLASVKSTSDGGCILVGGTKSNESGDVGKTNNNDIWLVKLNANGGIVSNFLYGGPTDDEVNGNTCMTTTPDGNFVIAGYTEQTAGGFNDFWVLKVNSNGEKIWDKTFGGSHNDRLTSILLNADGTFFIAGNTESSGSGDVGVSHGWIDGWVAKIKEK